ncbi:MAG: DUF2520 domain-containing protein [Acidobacteria bacterium]|nr:DUF2520 domain-containing protein [Acidobacteriota bacterium]
MILMKPTYSIIGPGRLGRALARAIAASGARVAAIGSRRRVRLRGLSAPITLDPATAASAADVVLITTGDSDITTVVDRILSSRNSLDGRVFLHCSGILTSDVLEPLRSRGASIGSLHPLQTFPLPPPPPAIFHRTTFYFEGDTKARSAARRLVKRLGSSLHLLRPGDKILYHAAAVMVSNYQVAIFDGALKLLGRCGFSRADGRKMLSPLAARTTKNLTARDPSSALTGPIARGDLEIVRMHVGQIRKRSPDLLPLYCQLGLQAVAVARCRGRNRRLDEIARTLRGAAG